MNENEQKPAPKFDETAINSMVKEFEKNKIGVFENHKDKLVILRFHDISKSMTVEQARELALILRQAANHIEKGIVPIRNTLPKEVIPDEPTK